MRNDLPVVAVPDSEHTATSVFLELLEETGLVVERFGSWAKAGELRRAQWRAATRLLEDLDLDEEALLRFGATFDLVDRLLADRLVRGVVRTYFNPLGGELAAQHGIKRFNDLAWAAARLADAGLRVVIVDLDAHHASGNEALLLDRSDVVTVSIHSALSLASTETNNDSNFNFSVGPGAGDAGFLRVLQGMTRLLGSLGDVDVLIVGGGADGLDSDSSSDLALTPGVFEVAGRQLGRFVSTSRASVLLGGGSGSLPHDGTPGVWLALFAGLSSSLLLSGEAVKGRTVS